MAGHLSAGRFLSCHAYPVAVCAIGGRCEGKLHVLERWRSVVPQFDIIRFDTSNLLINKNCAAAEITLQYRFKTLGRGPRYHQSEFLGVRGRLAGEAYRVSALEAVTPWLNARPNA